MNAAENDAARLTRHEKRTAGALAGVVALRLFGLFLILPVFASLARDMPGATPQAIGLAIGIYGLTQGLLQIPFGWLSDRVGRRPVIAGGLLLFVAGSVLAALSTHIAGVIAGRALQGGGAIAGAAMALASDSSRPGQRSKMMALIGAAVGAAFLLAMLAGPVMAQWWGISGLFWITAGLGLLALALLTTLTRDERRAVVSSPPSRMPSPAERQLCIGAFVLHAMLTAVFVALPVLLEGRTGIPVTGHWQLYVPAMAVAGVLTLAMIFRGRERDAPARLLPAAAALTVACVAFGAGTGGWLVSILWIAVFFAGFNLVEATLPALMSLAAPEARRGSVMGLYATSQFLGAFAGGVAGGWAAGLLGHAGAPLLASGAGGVWMILLWLSRGVLRGVARERTRSAS